MDKSRKRIGQDYARNAIKDGNTKAGKYEKKMAIKEAAGEGPSQTEKQKKNLNPIIVKAIAAKKGPKMYDKSKGPKQGAKKGDQSKSRADYSMDSGKTDKNYKGEDGSSKGDQSASRKDYENKGPKMMDKGGAYMESNAQEKSNLMNDNPIAARASGSWMSKHSRR